MTIVKRVKENQIYDATNWNINKDHFNYDKILEEIDYEIAFNNSLYLSEEEQKSGSLMQLISLGSLDAALTGQSQNTYFKYVYRKSQTMGRTNQSIYFNNEFVSYNEKKTKATKLVKQQDKQVMRFKQQQMKRINKVGKRR